MRADKGKNGWIAIEATNSSVVFFHHSLQIAFVFLFFYRLAFVVKLFASTKTEFDFDESVFKIDFERNKRIPFLFHFSAKFVDFGLVEQKLARATRIDVVVTSHFVWRDMRAQHKNFAVFDDDEAISKVYRTKTNGLDFAANESNARLVGVLDKVIVIGFFVCCNLFYHNSIIQYSFDIFKPERVEYARILPDKNKTARKTSRLDTFF